MEKVFLLPFKVSADVKSRDFQYRFINRCIYTNSFLKRIGGVHLELCTFCNEVLETVEHLFFECIFSKLFWNKVTNFFYQKNIYQESLSLKRVFIGDTRRECPIIVNHITILRKQFIYKPKLQENIPIYNAFKQENDYTQQIDKYIAVKNSSEENFHLKWSTVRNLTILRPRTHNAYTYM